MFEKEPGSLEEQRVTGVSRKLLLFRHYSALETQWRLCGVKLKEGGIIFL